MRLDDCDNSTIQKGEEREGKRAKVVELHLSVLNTPFFPTPSRMLEIGGDKVIQIYIHLSASRRINT